MNYFCFVSFFKNYHRLEKSLLLVCFLCSVCRILCVSVDISLNIHGYFITYPWIFHYVSAVTRVFCFVLAIYWLYVFGFSHIGGWFFVSRRLRRLSQIPFSPSVFFIFHTESTGNHRLWRIASLAPAIRDVCTRLGRQTVPLFIEGRAEQRGAEGVTSVARRETSFTWGILRAPFFNSAWNSLRSVRSALCTRPSINRGTVFLNTSIVTILFS